MSVRDQFKLLLGGLNARRAPSSSPARVLAIALPARDRVPPERRGGADATVVGTVERIRWSSGSRERSGTPT